MVSASLFFGVVGGLTTTVLAHGNVFNFTTNGVYNQGFLLDYYYEKVNTGSFPDVAGWYAEDLDEGFVSPDAYQTSDINCHKNSAPGAISATIPAGDVITFHWGPNTWPHAWGPIFTYVAACSGSCTTADKTTLQWVKIAESGIDLTTQTWASQVFINQGSTWSVTVPSSLKAGNYVFRHEIIALHGAGSVNGAQNYPQCFNIAVTGSGTKTLPSGTLGTALYQESDPGILINVYQTLTTYTMPGPTVWSG